MTRKRGADIRIVVAGAYTLDPEPLALHLLLGEEGAESWSGLARLPVGATVLLRSPLRGSPGPVERIVATLCDELSITVDWRVPVPGSGGTGTIERDRLMVEDSDAVVTYVDQRRADEGGTERIKRMGFQMDKHCWSFALAQAGVVAFGGASEQAPAWSGHGA